MGDEPIRVAELSRAWEGSASASRGTPNQRRIRGFRVVFSNQFEPGEKAQWASRIYKERGSAPRDTSGKSIHEFTFPKDGVA